ncbi:MAG: hypothetical protein JWR15_1508 [Prosthecobacter sp.]|nr:hypothetical protein [Prosthecobacter sp.]
MQAGHSLKFSHGNGSVHGLKLAKNSILQVKRHTLDLLPLKDRLSVFVCEMNDHGATIRKTGMIAAKQFCFCVLWPSIPLGVSRQVK